MGSKKTIPGTLSTGFKLHDASVMTSTTTIVGTPSNVGNVDNIGLTIAWTGTPTGTLTVQGSNDKVLYFDLTFDPNITQPGGSANAGYGVNLNQFPWQWLRVKYVNASGTGALTVVLFAKDLN